MIDEVTRLLDEMTTAQGGTETFLDGVTLYRRDAPSGRLPLLYDQCLCIAFQGEKVCHLSDRSFRYDSAQYLVVPTIVPMEVEAFPQGGKPLLSVTISIDFAVVQEIVGQIGDAYSQASASLAPLPGVYLESLTPDVTEPTLRLLKSLRTRGEAQVLGRQIVREIFFRTLLGENGHILASAARGESAYAKISTTLRTIHDAYAEPLDVPQLASAANMSVRSFHDHFKAVTSHTPVQYLKRIRLEKARQILAGQGLQAGVTAHMVGYESASQFSREFKRYFGYPPSEEAGRMMQMAG